VEVQGKDNVVRFLKQKYAYKYPHEQDDCTALTVASHPGNVLRLTYSTLTLGVALQAIPRKIPKDA
jgi:hypothetical protein